MKKDGLNGRSAPLKAFAYVRANIGSPERNLDSIVEQLKTIDAFAQRRGIEIVRSFFDADLARESCGPPEIGSMIARATAADRPVDYVIAASACRISRRRNALDWVSRRLLEAGVGLLCVSEIAADVAPIDCIAEMGMGSRR